LIIIAFRSNIQNPPHAENFKLASMLLGCDLGPEIKKVGKDG
jgi:hypothetical protein